MKRTTWMIATALVVAISYMPSSYAQTKKTTEMRVPATASVTGTVKVAIPFDFTVAGKTLKAGTYDIGLADEGNEMAIKSENGKGAVMAPTSLVSVANKVVPPKLVFHRYGDHCYLTQAWLNYSDEGREFFASAEELKMAHEYSQEKVILAMK